MGEVVYLEVVKDRKSTQVFLESAKKALDRGEDMDDYQVRLLGFLAGREEEVFGIIRNGMVVSELQKRSFLSDAFRRLSNKTIPDNWEELWRKFLSNVVVMEKYPRRPAD